MMHNEVKERVENKDIRGLQYVFVNCLDVDPTFEKYKEDYAYCCKNAPEMFEAHEDRTPLTNNQGSWNDDYWNKLKMDLLKNFSKKRFEHMRKVAQVVYAEKISMLKSSRKQEQEEEKRRIEEQNKNQVHSGSSSQDSVQQKVKESKQEQDREIAKEQKEIEESNRHIEEENSKKQRELDKNRVAYSRSDQVPAGKAMNQTGSEQSTEEIKKMMGAVLIVVVLVMIIIVLLICVRKK